MRLIDVDMVETTVKFWDIGSRVGLNAANVRLDVKFCQYMIFRTTRRLLISDVIGTWGPKSAAALKGFENANHSVLADGIIDPIPPGENNFAGKLSHKAYKLIAFQLFYVSDKLGIDIDTLRSGVFQVELSDTLADMPEDCKDMPADLRQNMISARDGGS